MVVKRALEHPALWGAAATLALVVAPVVFSMPWLGQQSAGLVYMVAIGLSGTLAILGRYICVRSA